MRICLLVGSLFLVLGISAPGGALAGEPRTHDGFFLRLSGGVGYGATSIDLLGGKLEVSGPTGDANLAIGGIVARNLALHATFFGWSVSEPDVELPGIGFELAGDVSLAAVGVGLTYYFDPSNLYLSGSIGAGTLQLDLSGGPEVESDTGVAVDLTVGKEWWSGGSWGLGLAGTLGFHSIPDVGPENFTGANFGLRFSATYN